MAKRNKLTNAEIVHFLSSTTANATFLQRLKIKYRPYVCPFDELLGYTGEGKSVYDIGCGSGQFCALVAEFTDSKVISGIEIDESLVDNAKKINSRFKKKKMTFSLFGGNTVPKDIGKYDLIYMIDVYHHIPTSTRDDFMKQVYEKMKPGAQLMFKDINADTPFVYCNKLHDLIFAQELSHEIGFDAAQKKLKKLGFKIKEARKKRVFVYPHYFILAQK